jgi:hypothetical protein
MLPDRNLAPLMRKIIAELRAFLVSQQKQVEAVAEYAKAHNKPDKPALTGPPEKIRNEVDFPPEVVNRFYSEHDKSYRLQRRTFWVGLLTLIALVAYTGFTYRLWRTTDDTFNQVKDQTTLMRQQLEGTMGAILSLDLLEIEQPPCCALGFTIGNGGHVTANNVTAHIILTIQSLPGKQTKGGPYYFSVGPQSLRAGGGGAQIVKHFSVPGLTQDFLDSAMRLETTARVEETFSYENGFGRTISQSECRSYLPGPFVSGDITKNIEPHPNGIGLWPCESFDWRMGEVRRTKALTVEEYTRQRRK